MLLIRMAIVILAWISLLQPACAAQFSPAKTWLFVVGVLQFKDASTTSWDSKNRRDAQLVSIFKGFGVPADHIVYVSDTQATESNIQRQLSRLLGQTQPNDFLIVYYTGHGADGSFETYEGNWWEMKSIVSAIEAKFRGETAMLLGDCCQSGSLADALSSASDRVSYAIISSSSKTEEGHGNWTFSQALIDGLTGDPSCDENKDGRITIQEIADHIRKDILAYEDNHSVFRTTGKFDTQMSLAATKTRTAPDPQPVEVLYNGDWWKAKLMEQKGSKAHVRWIQLGYDSPDQDEWVEMTTIRPIKSFTVQKN